MPFCSDLVERPRREPEVGGLAVLAPQLRQRVQERPLEVLPEGRLPERAARLLDADRRRDHRLVRAALGAERDAARRADEDRLAAGVDAERPRLERARHERVVDGPDRQQRLAVARPGRAELAEQADQVDLGDPELDVAAVVGLAPAHERVGVVGEPVDAVADDQIPTLLIQPPRFVEVPTSGETVTTRSATSGASRTRSTKKRPNACWVEAVPLCSRPRSSGTAGGAAAPGEPRAPAAARALAHSSASGVPSANVAHGSAGSAPSALRQLAVLRLGQQRGVVGRVALGRQPPALDRVGEDDRRPVAHRVGLAVAVEQRARGRGPPRSRNVCRSVVVAEVVGDAPRARRRSSRASARSSRWYSSLGIASMRCRSASPPAARTALERPYLTITPCQPGGLEHRGAAGRRRCPGTTRSSDWRLRSTTHMTSPRRAHHRVGDRLPAGALVELGVADQRDLAPADRHVEVPGDVAVRERAPDRRGRADADRAGRVVDRVGVLRRGSGRSAGRRTRAASSGSGASSRPSR